MLADSSGFKLEGYTFCGKSRTAKTAGGVGILVRDDIKPIITPHESTRNIEIFWISIQQEKQPIFCGVYYGRQESRTSKEEISQEIDNLCEEILEKKQEGIVILFMDGNAKIGILNEAISRNGRLLLELIEECELLIMNDSEICKGKVTRVNRKKPEEKSAIDFVLGTAEIQEMMTEMIVDEDEKFLLSGSSPTDHNSIIIKLQLDNIKMQKQEKITKWRLSAPEEDWTNFRTKLEEEKDNNPNVIASKNQDLDTIYNIWRNKIDNIARKTIGKTTLKTTKNEKISKELKSLRAERNRMRKSFENENDGDLKGEKLNLYIEKQKEVRQQIEMEHKERAKEKLERMMIQENKTDFWKECKKQKRDEMNNWTAIKDDEGKRILDPEGQKEAVAKYFENLYSPDDELPSHEHHLKVDEKIAQYEVDYTYDDLHYNSLPTMKEVEDVIANKKNKKTTTDFPNEMIKKGGKAFLEWLYPIIKAFWENEVAPKVWNQGIITTIYKGKGDREKMTFQRGITVSSTISMISEELLNTKMTRLVPLSQAQGGGKKGSSTRDHLFLLRGAMAYALKHNKEMYVTFYDVAKAYDRADVNDMLVEVWDHGMKGKVWRLMRILNTNLTAKIKTKHGLTREIQRKAGGKQGGINFGFLFSKLMDLIQEEAEANEQLGVLIGALRLCFLLWVDDVVSFAEGEAQQKYTLQEVNEFAVKHKLKWGNDKCKVLKIGKEAFIKTEWPLGKEKIVSCEQYNYLGDIIMKNNGNQKNIDERENKVKRTTRKIISMCQSEIINNMEVWALLKLHETTTVPTLLTNSETWVLGKEQRNKLERIEHWALKKLIGLPPTTPTTAVMITTGCLFTSQRIDQKQLIYLKTILSRPNDNWTKMSLTLQKEENLWWAKQISNLLQEYEIEDTWEEIRIMPFAQWKNKVKTQIEKKHIERMIDGEGTKTRFIRHMLQHESYARKPMNNVLNRSKIGARAIIMGMSGMLDCANNFHFKYKRKTCNECGEIDDESHRINYCVKYQATNLYFSNTKFDFNSIYLNSKDALDRAEYVILHLWDVKNGKNQMKEAE